jgi:hypothetical protein
MQHCQSPGDNNVMPRSKHNMHASLLLHQQHRKMLEHYVMTQEL